MSLLSLVLFVWSSRGRVESQQRHVSSLAATRRLVVVVVVLSLAAERLVLNGADLDANFDFDSNFDPRFDLWSLLGRFALVLVVAASPK